MSCSLKFFDGADHEKRMAVMVFGIEKPSFLGVPGVRTKLKSKYIRYYLISFKAPHVFISKYQVFLNGI